jgi:hypothetical protein
MVIIFLTPDKQSYSNFGKIPVLYLTKYKLPIKFSTIVRFLERVAGFIVKKYMKQPTSASPGHPKPPTFYETVLFTLVLFDNYTKINVLELRVFVQEPELYI